MYEIDFHLTQHDPFLVPVLALLQNMRPAAASSRRERRQRAAVAPATITAQRGATSSTALPEQRFLVSNLVPPSSIVAAVTKKSHFNHQRMHFPFRLAAAVRIKS